METPRPMRRRANSTMKLPGQHARAARARGKVVGMAQGHDERHKGEQTGQDPCEPGDEQARARDRAQLVVIAYETGLVVPGGAARTVSWPGDAPSA